MDFKKVIGILLKIFEEHDIEYAFIGGFALGALGIIRSTADIDLLVHKKDMPTLDRSLGSQRYQLQYRSENVSQYISNIRPLGSIDVLHAFRHHSLSILKRVRKVSIFDDQYTINVLMPEDIIGLKVQSMVNNPERETLELADIELILGKFHNVVDWQLLEEYFELFQCEDYLDTLKVKYGNAT